MTSKSTKRALFSSALAIVLCLAMLIGTTFAWFTDTASTGVNRIQAGNLKMEVTYKNTKDGSFDKVTEQTNVFKQDTLWEPGHAEFAVLNVKNVGTLALKYKLGINIASETGSTNVNGAEFKLSDYIKFAVLDGDKSGETRSDLVAAAEAAGSQLINAGCSKESHLDTTGAEKTVTLVVWMPETVGNEANYAVGKAAPEINLGIDVAAAQYTYESDSFGKDYDEDAGIPINVNTSNIQDYLDGKYGSIDGKTLVLAAGEYDTLKIGGVTADTKGDIVLTCNHTDGTHYSYTTAEEYKAHVAENVFHYTSTYTRTMNDVTFVADGNVTVKGVSIESGHLYQLANPFREGYTGYYMNHKLTNFTFSGINFVGNVNINTSSSDTVIDGFTFDKCTFTTNGATSDKGQALRYYNENNNGQVKNLTVQNCTFTNCYQGVYTMQVNGVSVINSKFETIGHNAIAVQSQNANVNHGAVVITGNTFNNVGDRIIRFNNVGADTQITIRNNTAANSGDSAGEVIKATTLATGITYDIGSNNWGGGKVVNTELQDK